MLGVSLSNLADFKGTLLILDLRNCYFEFEVSFKLPTTLEIHADIRTLHVIIRQPDIEVVL